MCVSCSTIFSFLTIFQVLYCVCFILLICQFSLHIPGPTSVYVSFSTFFSFLAIFPVLQCTFIIFYVFQCFLPYFTSYSVGFSFSMIFCFLNIVQGQQCSFFTFHIFCFCDIFYVLQFEFVIFLVGQFSCHNPGPTVCISHF